VEAVSEPVHEVIHRNVLGEAVCKCGELFEPGTLAYFWPTHIQPLNVGPDYDPQWAV
jgi:hypothetical protein